MDAKRDKMKIKPFAVEEWMSTWEGGARYNIAETCVDSVSLDELFELTGENKELFLQEFCKRRLTYGDIEGASAFKEGVCKLYKTLSSDEVLSTHGAAGANHHVFYSLISPGDHVVGIMPTYLCDEVYRHLIQKDIWCDSIIGLYEEGISVSSMSKVFSLAGLRIGWIATHDGAIM